MVTYTHPDCVGPFEMLQNHFDEDVSVSERRWQSSGASHIRPYSHVSDLTSVSSISWFVLTASKLFPYTNQVFYSLLLYLYPNLLLPLLGDPHKALVAFF